ncbi:primosomal protein N' [Microbacterium sp. HD4P20]|uniref:primosomal protein N' family DNA-binding protein n=1 Tax=Microbacterium sp. HD4P20 TaxID=2864874 RepID=UPI001C63C7C0|nr:primosomal protein N' [Microbacterium sp. HD4P20]MCP2636940.1 primosomal protein N' [Microbacterium sp. HD4P20]
MTARRVARVLIDSPLPQLDRLFDYSIPDELASDAVPGVRVRVPLRSAGRVVDGYLVEIGEPDASDRPLSELDAVVSPVPVLTPGLYALARRAADRAAGSASDILRLAIPRRMVRAEKAWRAAEAPATPAVSAESSAWALEVLSAYPGLDEAIDAGERLAVDAPPNPAQLPDGTPVGSWAVLLAASAVHALAGGRSAIVAVPDHRDRAQLEAVLAAHVPADALVRDDAKRSGPERYAAFLRTLATAPCIVIGNRSAVYAPVAQLGLVALWDDGDPLLAEPLSPGVHARDAALLRQELDGGALVFAGHTRTTDVERLVTVGWVRDLPAARRRSPRVVLTATREGESRGARVPSSAFAAAREALESGPVLVQVSRPGYAPVLVCAQCRHPARCAHCGGPLHAARQGAVPACTWCGRTATRWACTECSATLLRMASSGSERTADELGRAFPGTRVIVADGDHPVRQVDGRPALVVATRGAEPPAVGGYRAVILLDGDRMLLAEDLRIAESCLRWWSNAAALAAPGAPVHLVGVGGAVARALATWTHAAYARAELADRAPLRMPPTVRVAAIDGARAAVEAALVELRRAVPELDAEAVLGPLPRGEATRALVRFEYGLGARVAQSLRASVVAAAVKGRRPAKGRAAGTANTLRVRVDVPDLDL